MWGSREIRGFSVDYTYALANSQAIYPRPMSGQALGGVGVFRTDTGNPIAKPFSGSYTLDTYVTSHAFANGEYSLAQQVFLTLTETLNISDADAHNVIYGVALAEVLNMSDTAAAYSVLSAVLEENLSLTDAYVFNGVYGLILPETLLLQDTVGTNGALVAYVVNANTGALSTYSNFNFNSFAQMNGKLYGLADDGVYELAGATDNGVQIDATVVFGTSSLGTEQVPDDILKRLPTVYLGVNTDGAMQLNVTTNGVTNSYTLSHATTTSLHTGRMLLGRGAVSRYWDFELTNVAGADFTIESITLYPEALKRRIAEN